MTVLDSSALIALLMREPGAERVAQDMANAVAPTTILAEVVGYFARHSFSLAELRSSLDALEVQFTAVDHELAWRAGELEPLTKPAGLSLADRTCLALAARLGTSALTGDRQWPTITDALGIEIELFR